MASLVVGLLASAACGGSDGETFDRFLGTWRIEPTSDFTLTCPGSEPQNNASLWNEIILQPGTVADVIETSGACPFNYTVSGQRASIQAIDGLTGLASTCVLEQPAEDAAGNVFIIHDEIAPLPAQWAITLGPTVKNQAPTATFTGTAQVTETIINAAGSTPRPSCTYVVMANLTKIANH